VELSGADVVHVVVLCLDEQSTFALPRQDIPAAGVRTMVLFGNYSPPNRRASVDEGPTRPVNRAKLDAIARIVRQRQQSESPSC
jgi:hypothetical protein